MTASIDEILAALPEGQEEGFRRLIESRRQQYAQYGIPLPEGAVIPDPLTLAQTKDGEIRNSRALTDRMLAEHGGKMDAADWVEVWMSRATHNRDLPAFGIQTVVGRCWTPEEARRLVEASWTLPEWPGQHSREVWLRAFNEVGFICSVVEDGGTCQWHPAEDAVGEDTVQVWRGALMSARRGMSWTTDRDRALWFIRRGDMSGQGRKMRLWTTQATPERVLAHFHRRSEDEFVLDTYGIRIREEQVR